MASNWNELANCSCFNIHLMFLMASAFQSPTFYGWKKQEHKCIQITLETLFYIHKTINIYHILILIIYQSKHDASLLPQHAVACLKKGCIDMPPDFYGIPGRRKSSNFWQIYPYFKLHLYSKNHIPSYISWEYTFL